MSTITTDKYIQFVIENYSDIQALQEIIQHAEDRLPSLVNHEVEAAILELTDSYFSGQGLELQITNDEPEIWWYAPSMYDINKLEGLYFGFEYSIEWSNIIQGLPEDYATLYLYVDVPDSKSEKARQEYIRRWITTLRASEAKLRKSGLILWYNQPNFDWTYPYLVGCSLQKEISIAALADRESFYTGIQTVVKTFTSTLLPIFEPTIKG